MVLPLVQLPKTDRENRIAFVGPMASGKTWCADFLSKNHGYTRMSLAGKLKAIAYDMYGIQGKDGNDRLVLQGLGTDLRRYDKDVWLKYLLADIKFRGEQSKYFKPVIDDVRYVNEANVLRKNGFVLIRLVVPSDILQARITRLYPNRVAEASLHASETEQEGIRPDYIFTNDSTYDLSTLINDIR